MFEKLNIKDETPSIEFLPLTSSIASLSLPGTDEIVLFARGADASLVWKLWYGSGWSTWMPLGGQILAGTNPTACSWGPGRLDIFVIGTDGKTWHKWFDGALEQYEWSEWECLD